MLPDAGLLNFVAVNDIITELIKSEEVRHFARKLSGFHELWEDLLHHSILKLIEQGEEKIRNIYNEGKIRHYLLVTMYHEWQDPKKSFAKLYKHKSHHIPITDIEIPDEGGAFCRPSEKDVGDCKRYFKRVSPELILISRELERLKKHDQNNRDSKFHYRTAIMEMYLKHGSYNKTAEATDISRAYIIRIVKETKKALNEGIANNKSGHGA